jgi:7-cyano-7-deazaguanine synthase
MTGKKAVILLSGGIDSATAAAIARQIDFDLYALTFRYGQRHKLEVEAAKKVGAWLPVQEHLTIDCDLGAIGGSALTDNIMVPKGRSVSAMAHGIPITYVPARNTIFLSFGLAFAEKIEARDIFFGANQLDYSG